MSSASPNAVHETRQAIDAVWRIESAKLVGALTKMTRDMSLAEELAQDALVAAARHWPETGIPNNPGAWLMQTAKRKALDHFRRSRVLARNIPGLTYEEELRSDTGEDLEARLDDDVGDNVLSLIFTACHPMLSRDARAALTLRLVAGLSTAEIARAFLAPEPTIQQRIVRAKKTLAEAQVPFEVPRGPDRVRRLGSTLEVIYLIFNEGYSATAGSDWMRTELCDEALRLGRILARLVPEESEVHGLVALMEIQASRSTARVKPDGTPVLLLEQDRTRWNRILIQRGLAALALADRLASHSGSYQLQAAIAACHARAARASDTDWRMIALLYDDLLDLQPSPIVALNRAVAYAMADGPQVGLDLLDLLVEEQALKAYHLLPSVRGDLLQRLGRRDEAAAEFRRAASLTGNGTRAGVVAPARGDRNVTDLTYRLAMPSDYEQLSAVMRSASLAAADGDALQRLLERPELMEVEAELIGGNQVVVAADEKTIVGFASLKAEDGNDAEIEDLFVQPERWRQGIGRALVEVLEREAAAWGATRLHVTASRHASSFYNALGFKRVGDTTTEAGPVAFLMAKKLVTVV